MSKLPVTGGMRVKAYVVLAEAVESGVQSGWRRAHKHTDAPSQPTLLETIESEVLAEICARFDFDDADGDA